MGEQRPGGNNMVRIQAEKMADQIIERGLVHVNEVFGSEISLYYPELFAGTCDLVGNYCGKDAIMDFKTAKKIRSRKMIDDYFLQLSAYICCHNELYETDIKTGVIFMVDRQYKFILEGEEFKTKTLEWFDRVEMFLSLPSNMPL